MGFSSALKNHFEKWSYHLNLGWSALGKLDRFSPNPIFQMYIFFLSWWPKSHYQVQVTTWIQSCGASLCVSKLGDFLQSWHNGHSLPLTLVLVLEAAAGDPLLSPQASTHYIQSLLTSVLKDSLFQLTLCMRCKLLLCLCLQFLCNRQYIMIVNNAEPECWKHLCKIFMQCSFSNYRCFTLLPWKIKQRQVVEELRLKSLCSLK